MGRGTFFTPLCSPSPVCNSTLLGKKLKKRNCLELYEFQDGDWRPAHVITSGKGKNKNESKWLACRRRSLFFFPLIHQINKCFCSFCCSDEGFGLLPLL